MSVQLAASAETWILNARAYAASQRSTTWLMAAVAPRSTWIHCGSLKALDQRVPVLPSTAADAGVPAFSVDDAVAGRPCDSRVAAAAGRATMTSPATSIRASAMADERGRRGCMRVSLSKAGMEGRGRAAVRPPRRSGHLGGAVAVAPDDVVVAKAAVFDGADLGGVVDVDEPEPRV